MSGEKARSTLPAAVLTLAVLMGLQAANGQESWQPARGGASTWQAGTIAKPAPAAGTGSSAGREGWGAGARTINLRVQPGGIWTESSGSALPVSSKTMEGKAAALGAFPRSQGPNPAGILPLPTPSRSAPQLNRARTAHAGTGQRPAISSRFQKQNGKPGATFKFQRSKSISPGSHGQAPSHGSTGLGSPLGSSGENAPGLSSPLGGSTSNSGLGLGAPTGVDRPMR